MAPAHLPQDVRLARSARLQGWETLRAAVNVRRGTFVFPGKRLNTPKKSEWVRARRCVWSQ